MKFSIAAITCLVYGCNLDSTLHHIDGGTDAMVDAVNIDAPVSHFGPFTDQGNLVLGRMRSSVTAAVSKVYVIGGQTTTGVTGSIEVSSTTAPDFQTISSALVVPRAGHVSFIAGTSTGTYLWVVGGVDANGTTVPQIERAPVGVDGAIGGFTVVTADGGAEARRKDAAAVASGDQVYLIGGSTSSADIRSNVARASITADTLGTFALYNETTVHLSSARENMTFARVSNEVWLLGGQDLSGSPTNAVEMATYTNNVLGPFSAGPNLVTAHSGGVFSTSSGTLFEIGGANVGTHTALTSIESTSSSSPTVFVADGSQLAQARSFAVLAKFGTLNCVIGGTVDTTAAGVTPNISCATPN